MSKNPKVKASDKKKAAQDLEITVKSVVDAILKLGHEEKDANGGGTICSILKIKAYFIENDPEADAIIIGLQLKEALKIGVDEGAFHRPEKSAGSKINLQGSFVVPHNKHRDVIEPKKPNKHPPLTGGRRASTRTSRQGAEQEETSDINIPTIKLEQGTVSKLASPKVTQAKEKISSAKKPDLATRFEMYRKGVLPAKIDSEEEEDRPVRKFEPTIRRHQLKMGVAAASQESHRSPLTENRILRPRKK